MSAPINDAVPVEGQPTRLYLPIIQDDQLLPEASYAAVLGQAMMRMTMRRLVKRLTFKTMSMRVLRLLTGVPNRMARSVRGTVVTAVHDSDVRAEWVRAPGVGYADRVLLYLHGSAFTILSASTHRALVSRLSDRTGLAAFSVDYRLAPEHPFPAASDDALAAYRYLRRRYSAQNIVVAGDSAGAHLAVDLTLQLSRLHEELPAGLALFSPLIDLSLQLAAGQERHRLDPLISAHDCARLVGLYVGDADRTDPRITLTFDGITRFPPTLIQTGGNEMLSADARHLHSIIQAAGQVSYLQVWPGQMHVFQAIKQFPESAAALREAALFLGWTLQAPQIGTGRAAK